MEIFLAAIGILIIIVGIIGCFVPVLPGPPLAYIALLMLQIGHEKPFTVKFLVITAVIVVVVTALDYIVPALGTKKWGGSRYGMIGAVIGVIAGIFVLPPFGFLILPLLGAMIGEILNGAESDKAFKSAFGTLVGLVAGTILKLSVTIYIAFSFFTKL